MAKILGSSLLFVAVSGIAIAGGIPVPEIDAGSAVTAVLLFSGGLLILRARRRR